MPRNRSEKSEEAQADDSLAQLMQWAMSCPARKHGRCAVTIQVTHCRSEQHLSYASDTPDDPPFINYTLQR